jgi:hypothetical protein
VLPAAAGRQELLAEADGGRPAKLLHVALP